jgi:hypothetical protein
VGAVLLALDEERAIFLHFAAGRLNAQDVRPRV